ncbi:NAD(P)-binding protein [Lindgomyces ingoldianus]|uniref:NAD(P)-binding protein n=1 Tax=Lindgomyces ingoldianus TaxID=673940 RepID=A0ACB6QE22_9PLEO|nr:NAD(P)-binding protein [Lindgomyces ingoldianus]KAF2464391.1 NAD(P)-binding protein [Lindgomyces ingoldianus]
MARILITGSSDGLGLLTAKRLLANGHSVVLHARSAQRAQDASAACPNAESIVTGDLSSIANTIAFAEDVNKLGQFDCVVHNAGLYLGPFRKTADSIPAVAAVNTIAPYILTCLLKRPTRFVFVSSEMHYSGDGGLRDVVWQQRGEVGWDSTQAYCDSKLHNVMFAKAFARRWPDVQANSLDPGWVPTKMGGPSAIGSLDAAVETYVMLAEGRENGENGRYFGPGRKESSPKSVADDVEAQERLLRICEGISGVKIPV